MWDASVYQIYPNLRNFIGTADFKGDVDYQKENHIKIPEKDVPGINPIIETVLDTHAELIYDEGWHIIDLYTTDNAHATYVKGAHEVMFHNVSEMERHRAKLQNWDIIRFGKFYVVQFREYSEAE